MRMKGKCKFQKMCLYILQYVILTNKNEMRNDIGTVIDIVNEA